MKIYKMNLSPLPFSKIKNGKKRVEMRLAKSNRKEISEGDIIDFTNNETGEKISVEVISNTYFPNFKELYEHFPKEDLGYEINENSDYRDMNEYYSDSDIATYGVLAIEIQLIERN